MEALVEGAHDDTRGSCCTGLGTAGSCVVALCRVLDLRVLFVYYSSYVMLLLKTSQLFPKTRQHRPAGHRRPASRPHCRHPLRLTSPMAGQAVLTIGRFASVQILRLRRHAIL